MPLYRKYVTSISKTGSAKLTGDVTFSDGTNFTLTQLGNDISGAASGGSGNAPVEVTGTTQALAVNTSYTMNNASLCVGTLPASASVGDWIEIVGNGAGGWKVAQNALQQIAWNAGGADAADETTIGTSGFISSTDRYDSVLLKCITGGSSTLWVVTDAKGTITLA